MKKYCVIIVCCLGCKSLLDVIFTDDYSKSLYYYFTGIENDGYDCNDYAIVYDCTTGKKLGADYIDDLMYKDLESR